MFSYVPLHCKCGFSFLEGASHPEELIAAAVECGLEAIALTDRDGVHGIVEAHTAASERGIKLIVGSEVSIDDGSTIVLLAATRRGYGNLCTLITAGRRRSEKGASSVGWRELWEHAEDVIALWGGERSKMVGQKYQLLSSFRVSIDNPTQRYRAFLGLYTGYSCFAP